MICVPKFDVIASVVSEEEDGVAAGGAAHEATAGKRSREDIEKELRSVEHYEMLLKVLEVDNMALDEGEKEQVKTVLPSRWINWER